MEVGVSISDQQRAHNEDQGDRHPRGKASAASMMLGRPEPNPTEAKARRFAAAGRNANTNSCRKANI